MLFDCQRFFIPLGHELETNAVIANSTGHIIAGAGENQMTIGYIPESGNVTIAPGVSDNNDSVSVLWNLEEIELVDGSGKWNSDLWNSNQPKPPIPKRVGGAFFFKVLHEKISSALTLKIQKKPYPTLCYSYVIYFITPIDCTLWQLTDSNSFLIYFITPIDCMYTLAIDWFLFIGYLFYNPNRLYVYSGNWLILIHSGNWLILIRTLFIL